MLDSLLPSIGEAIFLTASFVVAVTGYVLRNYARFRDIYKTAKSSYFIVEEIGRKSGLVSSEKFELFEVKFKELMSWTLWRVSEDDIKLAHDLADRFCNQYRVEKVDCSAPSTELILSEIKSSPPVSFSPADE